MNDYLTIGEVAELLRTPIATVRYWRHLGTGPRGFKVGHRVLYARSDVEAFIAEARNPAAAVNLPPKGRSDARFEELCRVAEVYKRNVDGAPGRAVQEALGLSIRTAARRVAEARSAGLLGPTSQGMKRA